MENRLSASDLSSLFAERGQIHVHVGGALVVEGAPPSYEALLAHVENRLALVPRFRQRIVKVPLGIENPVWADDPRFDAARHVRHVAVPRPGRLDQLRALIGQLMSEPLDLEHPLWQLFLIDGLRGGRHAYLSKTHHALVDGVAAVDIGMILLDPKRRPAKIEPPEDPWRAAEPKPGALFAQAAAYAVQRPFRAAGRAAAHTARMPARTAQQVIRTAEAFTGLAAGGPACPKSDLNVRIGRDRRVAWVRTDLDRLKRARAYAEGASVNDVVLSIAAGALRRFLESREQEPPPYLVALVPVSLRQAGDESLGNRISSILVKLPVAEPDPRKRLATLRDETRRQKESDNARAASLVIEAAGWAPPTINRVLSSAMTRPLVFNLVVSNVPGPQQPLFLLGRQIREIYPYVPLSPQNHAVSIGLISYDGGVYFGLVGDRDSVPDLDVLADSLRAAIREQPVPRRKPAAKPKSRPKAKAKPTRKPARRTVKRPTGRTASRPAPSAAAKKGPRGGAKRARGGAKRARGGAKRAGTRRSARKPGAIRRRLRRG